MGLIIPGASDSRIVSAVGSSRACASPRRLTPRTDRLDSLAGCPIICPSSWPKVWPRRSAASSSKNCRNTTLAGWRYFRRVPRRRASAGGSLSQANAARHAAVSRLPGTSRHLSLICVAWRLPGVQMAAARGFYAASRLDTPLVWPTRVANSRTRRHHGPHPGGSIGDQF
jgi:hypothetical protein